MFSNSKFPQYFLSLVITLFLLSCQNNPINTEEERKIIITTLDSFNEAAAKSNFNAYMNFFADDAVFIGTDATENWHKKDFMVWAKPYFDKGATWNFKSIGRHIYFDKTCSVAWFDELLNTQMKICRGSGVLTKQDNEWKIQQYVLSMTIPNDNIDSVIKIKTAIEDSIINSLVKK